MVTCRICGEGSGDDNFHRRMSIVHHYAYSPMKDSRNRGCYLHRHMGGLLADRDLREFTDPATSMANLLFFLDLGPLHQPTYEGPLTPIENLRNYTELVRRLTIPYYEEARQYWDEALENGFFSGQNETWPYHTDNLKNLVRIYGDDRFDDEQ